MTYIHVIPRLRFCEFHLVHVRSLDISFPDPFCDISKHGHIRAFMNLHTPSPFSSAHVVRRVFSMSIPIGGARTAHIGNEIVKTDGKRRRFGGPARVYRVSPPHPPNRLVRACSLVESPRPMCVMKTRETTEDTVFGFDVARVTRRRSPAASSKCYRFTGYFGRVATPSSYTHCTALLYTRAQHRSRKLRKLRRRFSFPPRENRSRPVRGFFFLF